MTTHDPIPEEFPLPPVVDSLVPYQPMQSSAFDPTLLEGAARHFTSDRITPRPATEAEVQAIVAEEMAMNDDGSPRGDPRFSPLANDPSERHILRCAVDKLMEQLHVSVLHLTTGDIRLRSPVLTIRDLAGGKQITRES